MKNRILRALPLRFATQALVVALALIVPAHALATVVKALTLEELTDAAPTIVRGTVGQVSAQWDKAEGKIWTYAEIELTDPLKGSAKSTLIVKQPGGEIGGIGQYVAGTAKFRTGQDALFFLEPAVDEKATFLVTALAAGKIDFEKNKLGELRAVRHLDGLAFAGKGRDGKTIRSVGDTEDLGPAAALLSRVRKQIAGGGK